jgi:hypothetical protein
MGVPLLQGGGTASTPRKKIGGLISEPQFSYTKHLQARDTKDLQRETTRGRTRAASLLVSS